MSFEFFSEKNPCPNFVIEFANVGEIVRKDPYRIGMLSPENTEKFLTMSHNMKRQHWVCKLNGKSVGRISANLSVAHKNVGYMGFFEATDKTVAKALIEEASKWLVNHDVNQVYGPVNYSTWYNYRFQTNAFTEKYFYWEPVNPPDYIKYFEDSGFIEGEKYFSAVYEGFEEVLKRTQQAYDLCLSKGFRFEDLDLKTDFDNKVQSIYEINSKSFNDAFLVEPMTLEFYKNTIIGPLKNMDLRYSCFLISPEGKKIGYFFNYADSEYLVWKTAAIMGDYQGQSLATAATYWIIERGFQNGFNKLIGALMKHDAPSVVLLNKISKFLWRHDYSIYQKSL